MSSRAHSAVGIPHPVQLERNHRHTNAVVTKVTCLVAVACASSKSVLGVSQWNVGKLLDWNFSLPDSNLMTSENPWKKNKYGWILRVQLVQLHLLDYIELPRNVHTWPWQHDNTPCPPTSWSSISKLKQHHCSLRAFLYSIPYRHDCVPHLLPKQTNSMLNYAPGYMRLRLKDHSTLVQLEINGS